MSRVSRAAGSPGPSPEGGSLDRAPLTSAEVRTEVRLHRRRQIVVVRASESSAELCPLLPRGRRSVPTLPGLDARERLDTIPDPLPEAAPAPHASSPRPRPVVLRDDVDDDLAQEYLAEAERILREGLLVGTG